VKNQKYERGRQATARKGAEILDALHQRKAIDAYSDKEQARQGLVRDYLASTTPDHDKLALGHSRQDVAALNRDIRQGLQAKGQVQPDAAVMTAKDGPNWVEMALGVGDRIRFTARDEEMGVINGTRGVVSGISKSRAGGFDITVALGERSVRFNSYEFRAIAHDYAMTIHKAQGQGKRDIFHLADPAMMDNQSALVAFTRLTKGRYVLYGSADDIDQLGSRMGLERLKSNAIEEGVRQEQPIQVVASVRETPEDKAANIRRRAR